MMSKRNCWILGMLFSFLAGCTSVQASGVRSEDIHVPLTVFFNSGQCDCKESSLQVKLLDDDAQLSDFLEQNSISTIGPDKVERQYIDFSKNAAVAIWMGRKPTAGYRLTLEKAFAEIKADTAYITVNVKVPRADAVLPQVITSPCLLIVLPRGRYGFIEILDQKYDRIGRLSLQNKLLR